MPITLERIEVAPGVDRKVQMTGVGTGSAEALGNQVLAIGTYLLGEEMEWAWFGHVDAKVVKAGGFLGFGKRLACLVMAVNVLHHYNCIINDNA